MVSGISKEIICRELIKNGYSVDNGAHVYDIADRSFRYINIKMAKAFLKLRVHPRYKTTIIDTEIKLLKQYCAGFFKGLENSPFNLIDISCVDGTKAKVIASILPKDMKIRYCPVSVNDYLIKLSLENIKKENFSNIIDYAPRVSNDFESLDQVGTALRNVIYQKNVFLLLDSFLASFEINDYLFRLSQSMLPDDLLLVGNGIRKGDRFANLETYKHHLFNEWLNNLIYKLDFNDNEVEYNVRFTNNRLEIYYKIKTDKIISYEKNNIEFKKGDEIIVAFQYKLYANELRDFCDMYFDNVELMKDPTEEYALVLCRR